MKLPWGMQYMEGQGRACGNIGNMLLKEPVKAVHYYTETLRLSTDRSTKVTGYHNRDMMLQN